MYAGSGIESYKAKPSYKANARLNKAQGNAVSGMLSTIIDATAAVATVGQRKPTLILTPYQS